MKNTKCLFMSTLLLSSSLMLTMENKDLANISKNTGSSNSKSDQQKIIEDFSNKIAKGNLEKVKELISSVKDINAKNSKGHTALTRAIGINIFNPSGNAIITFLIENGADINAKGKYEQTPLITACRKNKLEIIKLLIQKKANLNFRDEYRWTALMFESMKQNTETVKLLIESGADIYNKANGGETAFSLANETIFPNKKVCELLNNADNKNKLLITELTNTILDNNENKLVKFIIKHPDLNDSEGNNALHIIAKLFNFDLFKVILKIKPSLLKNENHAGLTPLEVDQEMLIFLISNLEKIENQTEAKNIDILK